MVAVDGTKLSASATSDSNVDYDRIAREIIAEAIATDEAEDEKHGDARGDELPPELQTEAGRREWLARELDARTSETPRARRPRGASAGEPMDGFDVERILARTQGRVGWLREAHRQQDRSGGRPPGRSRARGRAVCVSLPCGLRTISPPRSAETRPMRRFGSTGGCTTARLGGPPKPYTPPEIPQGEVNVTDPDSRRMKGNRRYIQGYNAQAVVNEQQIVLAAEITAEAGDFSHLGPMIDAALSELEQAGISDTADGAVADAQYWNEQHIDDSAEPRDPGADPAGLRQTQRRAARLDRRALFVHAPGLQPTTAARPTENDRNRSSRCSVTPSTTANSPVSPKRPTRCADRVAINHGESQPHQPPPPPNSDPEGLNRPQHRHNPPTPAARHQPPDSAAPPQRSPRLCATATARCRADVDGHEMRARPGLAVTLLIEYPSGGTAIRDLTERNLVVALWRSQRVVRFGRR